MKNIILTLAIILALNFCFPLHAYGDNDIENISVGAKSAILYDGETGRVLWAKNENEPMSIASTTKIMTLLIAIEKGNLEETALVSKRASLAPNVKLGVKEGEIYKLENLLYPLMLESSNDVAIVIAEHVGGSVEGFAELMNEKAKEIGALNTFFVTPNGLDENNNHSTAYDMALITAKALENEKVREVISTPSFNFSDEEKKRSFYVSNKNRLLNEYSGAIGVKTGFTNLAGHCFVGAVEKDGKTFITVVLASGWGNVGKEGKWTDTKKLLDYGFENYELEQVLLSNEVYGKTIVLNSEEKWVNAISKENGFAMLNKENEKELMVKAKIDESVEAPINKGEKLGEVWVETLDGEVLFKTDLIAEKDVERKTFISSAKKLINIWLN